MVKRRLSLCPLGFPHPGSLNALYHLINPFSFPKPKTEGKCSKRSCHCTGVGHQGRRSHFNEREYFFYQERQETQQGRDANQYTSVTKEQAICFKDVHEWKITALGKSWRHLCASDSLLWALSSLKAGISIKINLCTNWIILHIILIRILKPSNM